MRSSKEMYVHRGEAPEAISAAATKSCLVDDLAHSYLIN